MILNGLSILVVIIIAYMWLTRGFFSALIHFLCTLIAGAIAFGFWETVAYALLDGADTTGVIAGSAWAIGLALPFAVSLIVVRFIADRLLRSNVIVPDAANYAGGGALGLASGVISVGIIAISASYLRVDFIDSKSFDYNSFGNVVRKGGMWVPFDKVTAKLYGHLSERALRVDDPLARWQPASYEMGNGMRISPFDSKGRNTFRPEDFDVKARFQVGDPDRGKFTDVLRDGWNSNTQQVTDPNGQAYPADTHLEGVVITFKSGAREKDGKVAMGAAQIMMVLENDDDEREVSFPIAVTSQAEPSTPGAARFRYDSSGVFIASSGAASEATMAFEFPCRRGFRPVAVYVKGVRHDLSQSQPAKKFATWMERDTGLSSLGLGSPVTFTAAGAAAAVPSQPSAPVGPGPAGFDTQGADKIVVAKNAQIPGVNVTVAIPIYTLQDGQHGNLQLRPGGGNQKGPIVVGGELRDSVENAKKWGNITERILRIDKFIALDDRVMVQVEVSKNSRVSLLGKSFDAAEALLPPVLVDTQGEMYQPVGYVYVDETEYRLSFDPSQPIRSMSQLPTLTTSRPQQRLILLFQVSLGREIKYFAKGKKIVNEFEPPIDCKQKQMN